MSRVLGFVFALAVFASAAHSEEDRSAYAQATARLTEQLNATISARVDLSRPAPPAKQDEAAKEGTRSQLRASR